MQLNESKPSKRAYAHNELIAALRNPACYSHAVDSVELVETHISWVLLAGDFAYKIKKPVKFSFVDFSTLPLRKYFCEEELRLNRRFAPALYCDVVSINGSVAAPHIDATGEPIEYALKLRRFPANDELTELLDHDAIGFEELRHFGRDLARIQANLPVVATTTADDVARTTEDNCDELSHLIGPATADGFRESLRAGYAESHALISQRCGDGHVRECHGDLHAGNVVRVDGALVAFDCIEFNRALREIDVLHDVAFLVMDLQARDRTDLAYAFLNAWLETTGDFQGLRLLSYSCAQRALIRSKIEMLEDRKIDDPQVQRYLRQANSRLAPKSPRLFIACGLSGSGKTWLSTQLSTRLAAIHVRSDVERKRLAGLGALEDSRSSSDAGIYTREFNARTYDRIFECASTALDAGETTIVDAAFLRQAERGEFFALANKLCARFTILYCEAPNSILKQRIITRGAAKNDASEATLEVLAKQRDYWEPFTQEELAHVVHIDTTTPVESIVGSLL